METKTPAPLGINLRRRAEVNGGGLFKAVEDKPDEVKPEGAKYKRDY
jgi:hypothetical protein